jgi:triacylglycerol lipase
MGRKLVLSIILILGSVIGWLGFSSNSNSDMVPSERSKKVLLLPGYGGSHQSLKPLGAELSAAGFEVRYADLDDMKGDLKEYGERVGELIKKEREIINIIAYSAGGLVVRSAAGDNEVAKYIGSVVTIGSPHNGAQVAKLGALLGGELCPTSCQQLNPDSRFLDELFTPNNPKRWLSIRSSADEVVIPIESSILSGMRNLEVNSFCGEARLSHGDLVVSKSIARVVIKFLKGEKLIC